MSGEEIVEKFRTRKRCSGSVGAFFLVSSDADNLLAYIEELAKAAGRTPEDNKGDTDTQTARQ